MSITYIMYSWIIISLLTYKRNCIIVIFSSISINYVPIVYHVELWYIVKTTPSLLFVAEDKTQGCSRYFLTYFVSICLTEQA